MASGNRREFEGGARAVDPAGSIARAPVARQSFRSGNRSDGFSWRLAAFYAAFFGFSGVIMPFFPAWLQAKGLDSRATGIVLAIPMFIRLISVPSLARLADRRSALRGALIASAFGSAAAYVVLSRANGFVPIVLAVALASLATAPTMPLLDAYALKGLALRGRAYSPVRLWGSVAFVIANFGAGFVIDRIAPIQIIWLLFGSLVIVAAVSLTLRPIAPDAGSADDVDAAAGKLLLSPGFWVFTGGASLIQASHAVYYGFSVLDWRAKGLDAASIGGLWGLAVIAEIALFALSARFPQRIGSLGLLGVGALGAVLRWGVMSSTRRWCCCRCSSCCTRFRSAPPTSDQCRSWRAMRPPGNSLRPRETLPPRSRWPWLAVWHSPARSMPISAIAPMRRWRWQRLWAASSCCQRAAG